MKILRRILILILLIFLGVATLLLGPGFYLLSGRASLYGDWSNASRHSAGIAPSPTETSEAIVQVYAARAFRWRGAFAVHTWIENGEGAIQTHQNAPDRHWYGAKPELLADLRGEKASRAIKKITKSIAAYPYKGQYRSWPGPNSNTFTAHILRDVPELQVDFPPTAIGKDFLGPTTLFARAPSGRGFQFSVFGLLGALISVEEGIEFNLMGLSFGLDPGELALRLPGFGLVKP
jgi:hypothetical protein